MVETLELRWFWPAPGIERPRLFDDAKSATRTDRYAPTNPTSGIKLREGNLDIKVLVDDFGPRRYSGSIGILQHWAKSTYRSGDDSQKFGRAIDGAGWISVTKTRSLLVYDTHQGPARLTDGWRENGCQFEWTVVECGRESWLTVGLEAWGDAEARVHSLAAASQVALNALPPRLVLSEATSASYPGWLHELRSRS